jgi:hypothetical protein
MTQQKKPQKNRLRDVLLSPKMPALNEFSENKENISNLSNTYNHGYAIKQSSSDIEFVLNS